MLRDSWNLVTVIGADVDIPWDWDWQEVSLDKVEEAKIEIATFIESQGGIEPKFELMVLETKPCLRVRGITHKRS